MKKIIMSLALFVSLSCPAWAGPLMDAAQEASKEPLKVITTPKQPATPKSSSTQEEFAVRQKDMFKEIEMNAMGPTWKEWKKALEEKAQLEKSLKELYSPVLTQHQQASAVADRLIGERTNPYINSQGADYYFISGVCQQINSRFPGTNFSCLTGSGDVVLGLTKASYNNWMAVEWQNRNEGPITYTVSYPQQVIKYSDNNSNHITFKIVGPNQVQVIEARLPDMADASAEIIPPDSKKRAFNIKSNFLIQLLNDVYAAHWKDKVGMGAYAHDIIAYPESRALVIQQAGELYTQPAKTQSKPQQEK